MPHREHRFEVAVSLLLLSSCQWHQLLFLRGIIPSSVTINQFRYGELYTVALNPRGTKLVFYAAPDEHRLDVCLSRACLSRHLRSLPQSQSEKDGSHTCCQYFKKTQTLLRCQTQGIVFTAEESATADIIGPVHRRMIIVHSACNV